MLILGDPNHPLLFILPLAFQNSFLFFFFFFFASFLTQWRWFFLVFGKKTPAQEEGGLQERRQEARGGWNVGTFTDQQQEQGEPPGNPPTPLHPQLGL